MPLPPPPDNAPLSPFSSITLSTVPCRNKSHLKGCVFGQRLCRSEKCTAIVGSEPVKGNLFAGDNRRPTLAQRFTCFALQFTFNWLACACGCLRGTIDTVQSPGRSHSPYRPALLRASFHVVMALWQQLTLKVTAYTTAALADWPICVATALCTFRLPLCSNTLAFSWHNL